MGSKTTSTPHFFVVHLFWLLILFHFAPCINTDLKANKATLDLKANKATLLLHSRLEPRDVMLKSSKMTTIVLTNSKTRD